VDFFSARSLSRFYMDMIYRDKRIMAKDYLEQISLVSRVGFSDNWEQILSN
jgi:hypothetical protein